MPSVLSWFQACHKMKLLDVVPKSAVPLVATWAWKRAGFQQAPSLICPTLAFKIILTSVDSCCVHNKFMKGKLFINHPPEYVKQEVWQLWLTVLPTEWAVAYWCPIGHTSISNWSHWIRPVILVTVGDGVICLFLWLLVWLRGLVNWWF